MHLKIESVDLWPNLKLKNENDSSKYTNKSYLFKLRYVKPLCGGLKIIWTKERTLDSRF
jgi:hypothetical protein